MNNKPTMGIYAGSFNPFTIGHLDIVKQSAVIFDTLLVAQGINPSKAKVEKFPLPAKFLANFDNIKTTTYDTLLIELVKQYADDYNVTLVRGLRNGADLEYEQNLIAFLKEMYPPLKSVAFYCDPRFRHISSSALRDIKNFSETEYRKYVVTD
jgi:pantetheine-phosphate adenylyltransferase